MAAEILRHAGDLLARRQTTEREHIAVRDIVTVFERMRAVLLRLFADAFDFRFAVSLLKDDAQLLDGVFKEFCDIYKQVGEKCKAFAIDGTDLHKSDLIKTVEERHLHFKPEIERLDSIALLFKLIEEHWQANRKCKDLQKKLHAARDGRSEQNAKGEATSSVEQEQESIESAEKRASGKDNDGTHTDMREEDHGIHLPKEDEQPDLRLPKNESGIAMPTSHMSDKATIPPGSHIDPIDQAIAVPGNGDIPSTLAEPQSGIGLVMGSEGPSDIVRKFGRSFSTVEDAVHHRGHARAVTEKAPNYSTNIQGSELSVMGEPRLGSVIRRNGHSVPRIFTGSFSELEDSIRKLRLPVSEIQRVPQTAGIHSVAVTTARTTPLSSVPPSPRMPPSPATLQRREALLERDVAFQDRIIKGDVIRSRRPSDRVPSELALNISGNSQQHDALERWLDEEVEPTVLRASRGQKKNTL
ncbi:unnamed protein product [Zymoseptoria tritici ST99CH_1A5]|uniref:Uncharacterized protein n=1 Tax=Zymoseptoria tritici ST99CH_1A5 TaxID=1276529 RepID=A0A1Y6L5X3_ZYMTR|nr:unnamed protein product [Zymoseptoria tritici ST99CH_1A5]